MNVSDDWAAVANAINKRVAELGWRQRELAERSHVSLAIVREIQRHTVERRRSPRTLESLSVALGWAPNHLDQVLNGHVPSTAAKYTPEDIATLSARLEALEGQMGEVIELLSAVKARVETLIEHGRRDE
jgi:transcriptional regulator with XRE-family HTH domain